MRLVKSPASPTINQLGFRDVGKSGVAFSRRVSGCSNRAGLLNAAQTSRARISRWCLDSVAARYGESPNRGWRMLVNVFSNTTPPRVKAEGVSIVGLALSFDGRHRGAG